MKIQTIEINNYKAFHGNYKINAGGKNLFIYGENGSGKSSLYYALKDFFPSSIEDIDLNELENIFLPDSKKGNAGIKVSFICIDGDMDIRKDKPGGYKFSWDGNDECDPASGFGKFTCEGDTLTGRIYIHNGDDSSFVAKKTFGNELLP